MCTMVSMYFDDAHLASAKGSGQQAFGEVNHLLGSPFASEKRQPMSTTGTFLGLDWDFGSVATDHAVMFWVRSRLQAKVEDLLTQAEGDNALAPGLASKLYGMLIFLEQGVYGRIGTGGLNPLKERQHETSRVLTQAIRDSFGITETEAQARSGSAPRLHAPDSSLPVTPLKTCRVRALVASC